MRSSFFERVFSKVRRDHFKVQVVSSSPPPEPCSITLSIHGYVIEVGLSFQGLFHSANVGKKHQINCTFLSEFSAYLSDPMIMSDIEHQLAPFVAYQRSNPKRLAMNKVAVIFNGVLPSSWGSTFDTSLFLLSKSYCARALTAAL